MIYCEYRKKYGEQIPGNPSLFWIDISEDLVVYGYGADAGQASEKDGIDFFAGLKASLED